MGWLRKVGRKIGKRLNKIFGSKLGPVVGAIGLYMLMGPVAKTLTGWASSAFGGAGAAASGTAATTATTATTATQAATTAASDAAAAEAIAASGVQSAGASAKLSETALLAGDNLAKQAVSTTATNQTVAGQIANATNNMDMANSAISAIDSAALSGSTNVAPTITDSLIQEALPALDQTVSTVQSNVASMKDFGIQDINLKDFVPTEQVPDSLFEKGLFDGSGNLVAEQGATFAQAASDPTKFARLQEGATFGEKIGRFASDPIGLTSKGAKNLASAAVEGVTSGEFVGDVGKGVTTSLIMQEIAGDPEERFVSAGVAGQPISEAAQGNYVQSVSPSAMAATGMTRPLSFQELSQQTLYGTGSPNYLSQFYQPLATPQIG
jgi:hypothetical protein